MPVAGVSTVVFEKRAFTPDPGRRFSALSLPCDCGAEVGEPCKARRICAGRIRVMHELVRAGEAGPGEVMMRPERTPAVWNPSINNRNQAAPAPRKGSKLDDVARLSRAGRSIADIAQELDLAKASVSAYRAKARHEGIL